MTRIDIEDIKRADIDVPSTVGDLRRVLEDPRIPDAADIIYISVDVRDSGDEFTVADFEAGKSPTETEQVVNLVIEWPS